MKDIPLIAMLMFFLSKTCFIWASLFGLIGSFLTVFKMHKSGIDENSALMGIFVISHIVFVAAVVCLIVAVVNQGSEFFQMLGLMFL